MFLAIESTIPNPGSNSLTKSTTRRNKSRQNITAASPHGSRGGEGCYPKVARSLLRLVMGRNNAFSMLQWHFTHGTIVVRQPTRFRQRAPLQPKVRRDLDALQASEPDPLRGRFVKRSRQTRPSRVRFGILRSI